MSELAVDLGTWSVAAVLTEGDAEPRIVPDPETGRLWSRASVARSPEGSWLVGSAAEEIRDVRPDLYRDDLKRLLASSAPVYLGDESFAVSDLLARILDRCVANARTMTRESLDFLVLGVPVTFEGARVEALRSAADAAGFADHVVALVPEPVAAAHAVLDDGSDGLWLVVDLGGGTLDLALIQTSAGTLTVLDANGDDTIGGFAIDDAVVEYLRQENDLPSDGDDPWAEAELIVAARTMKHQLSTADTAYARNPHRTGSRQLTLTRPELAALIRPVADGMVEACHDILRTSGLGWSDVTSIIPSGGATRSVVLGDVLSRYAAIRFLPSVPELTTAYGLARSLPAKRSTPPPVTPTLVKAERRISSKTAARLACRRSLDHAPSPGRAVAFSPDGAQLVTAGRDARVVLWDPSTAESGADLAGPGSGVAAPAFSADGTTVATATSGTSVRLWNTRSQTVHDLATGHDDWVNDLAFSSDGVFLATASADETIRIWDLSTLSCLQVLRGHANIVAAVAFSPDGSVLASGSWDDTVRIWDTSDGEPLDVLAGHRNFVAAVAFSPDGESIASASWDETACIWSPSAEEPVRLVGHTGDVRGVAFSVDGSLVATAGRDHTVRLWDPAGGKCIRTLTGHTTPVDAVSFSPDGAVLASSGTGDVVRLWDIAGDDTDPRRSAKDR